MAANGKDSSGKSDSRDEAGLTPAQRAWATHIQQAEAEGLSFRAYCGREGLNVGGLYAARKVLRGTKAEVATSPPRLAAVRLSQPGPTSTAQVRLPNGIEVTVSLEGLDDVTHLVLGLSQLGR